MNHELSANPQSASGQLLDIAICTSNRPDYLRQLLETIASQPNFSRINQIFIIENGDPNERYRAVIDEFSTSAPLSYHHDSVANLSRARNSALKLTSAPWLAFIDDDVTPSLGWLSAMVKAIKAFPQAGIIAGRVDPLFVNRRPVWLADELLGFLSVVNWGGPLRELRSGEWVCGANMGVNVGVATALGGFDSVLGRQHNPDVLLSNEEFALVSRMRDSGYAAIWQPDAVVKHRLDPVRLTKTWLRSRAAWQAVSDFYLDPNLPTNKSEDLRYDLCHSQLHMNRGWWRRFIDRFSAGSESARFYDEVRGHYAITAHALNGTNTRHLLRQLQEADRGSTKSQ
jgi:glycosyltransferase involved in cell wall biosynthesis